ncbi:hypothetical protein RUND412_003876 [Rhizina undulata]
MICDQTSHREKGDHDNNSASRGLGLQLEVAGDISGAGGGSLVCEGVALPHSGAHEFHRGDQLKRQSPLLIDSDRPSKQRVGIVLDSQGFPDNHPKQRFQG